MIINQVLSMRKMPTPSNPRCPTTSPTSENIDQAIAWYESYKKAIAAAMPIKTPGVEYRVGYLEEDSIFSRYIRLWQEEDLGLNLAICYIHSPITAFYREIRKAKQTNELETEKR